MQLKVVKDWDWSDRYLPQVRAILLENLHKMIEIKIASREADTNYATDLTLSTSGGDIAVRIRRADCRFRDLTIRAMRDSGAKTELTKIREGNPRWYFYAWEDNGGALAEWIIVDLDKVRAAGMLNNLPLQSNHDGTWFVSIKARDLYLRGCLIAYQSTKQKEKAA